MIAALTLWPHAARAGALKVAVDPSGTVTSQPAGINCPGACAAQFTDGEVVRLTAKPAPGYVFGAPQPDGSGGNLSGWQTSCAPTAADDKVCDVTIGAGTNEVTAHFRPAAQLDIVPSGRGTVTATIANPAAGEQATQVCTGRAFGGVQCIFAFLPASVVSLTAQADTAEGPSAFVRWSDDRCPAEPQCRVTLDAQRQSVAALFTPQRVHVTLTGAPGTSAAVMSTPEGLGNCTLDPGGLSQCNGDFPLFSDITLVATGANPTWLPAGCDAISNSTCRLTANGARWPSVGFGVEPRPSVPAVHYVLLRVRRGGSGSGTARGGEIDCGKNCETLMAERSQITLVADPAAGSRFVRWRGACGANPRCTLAVGPETRLSAVFDRSGPDGPPVPARFQARIGKLSVSGRGARRIILIPVAVSARAAIRARLFRARRQIATRRWPLSAGIRLLRIRVPKRTRSGLYKMRLTVRDASGRPYRFVRTVRLGR